MINDKCAPSISQLLAYAIAAVRRHDLTGAAALLHLVAERRTKSGDLHGQAELKLIEALRQRCGAADKSGALNPLPVLQRVGDGFHIAALGVTIVTCCMNRTDNLLKALPTWLAHSQVSEVVIVDWSSSVSVLASLREHGIHDRRIRVVRVVDEPRWVLSYAFNLGFRVARHALILKVDADITLKSDFFQRNPLGDGTFVAGNWEAAAKGQEHINGFFYVRRDDLLAIKGFNEYLTTYGWDDDDIYSRLVLHGLRRVCVDIETIYHIPHDDSQRLGGIAVGKGSALAQLEGNPLFKIRSNRFIAATMPNWNADRFFAPFSIEFDRAGYSIVRRLLGEMPHQVTDDIRRDAEYYAALELISWQFGLEVYNLDRAAFYRVLECKRIEETQPSDFEDATLGAVATQLPQLDEHAFGAEPKLAFDEHRELPKEEDSVQLRGGKQAVALSPPEQATSLFPELIGNFSALDVIAQVALTPTRAKRRRLYVDVQHGLGNRLRALASAAALARACDRELVVLWAADHHCDCRISDLFDYPGAYIEGPGDLPADLRRYNYMEVEPGACKDEPIDLDTPSDVVVRSAFVLKHPSSSWDTENTELRLLRPSAEVVAQVNRVLLPPRCIGVHVRMEAGRGKDLNSYDSASNWSTDSQDQIHYWRERSHYSGFIRRLDQLISCHPERKIFLATDLQENYDVFSGVYGGRLHYLPRDRWDRSKGQIISAMADAMLLSRCSMLLGSTWSSFSELSMRLSVGFESIEMSGRDF